MYVVCWEHPPTSWDSPVCAINNYHSGMVSLPPVNIMMTCGWFMLGLPQKTSIEKTYSINMCHSFSKKSRGISHSSHKTSRLRRHRHSPGITVAEAKATRTKPQEGDGVGIWRIEIWETVTLWLSNGLRTGTSPFLVGKSPWIIYKWAIFHSYVK